MPPNIFTNFPPVAAADSLRGHEADKYLQTDTPGGIAITLKQLDAAFAADSSVFRRTSVMRHTGRCEP